MASAKKCDRCGNLYEHYGEYNSTSNKNMNGVCFITIDETSSKFLQMREGCKDLCPRCMESFKRWYQEASIKDEPPSKKEQGGETDA